MRDERDKLNKVKAIEEVKRKRKRKRKPIKSTDLIMTFRGSQWDG